MLDENKKYTFLEKVGVGSKDRTETADEWDNNGWEEDPGRKIYHLIPRIMCSNHLDFST